MTIPTKSIGGLAFSLEAGEVRALREEIPECAVEIKGRQENDAAITRYCNSVARFEATARHRADADTWRSVLLDTRRFGKATPLLSPKFPTELLAHPCHIDDKLLPRGNIPRAASVYQRLKPKKVISMKVIIASTPVIGHLAPLLSIARILIDEGHEVVVNTGSILRHRVEEIGAKFHALLPDCDLDFSDIDALLPERKHLVPGLEQLRYDFQHVFLDPMPFQFHGLRELLRDFPADVIIADSWFHGTLPMLLGPRSERPSIIHCGVSALWMEREDFAPVGLGLPPATLDAQREEYREIRAAMKEPFSDVVQQCFDQHLQKLNIDLPDISVFNAPVVLPDLYLQQSVRGFEYPRQQWPATVRFVGALPLPVSSNTSMPDFFQEIDGSRRVVLVTQGTVANHDLGQVIAPTLIALANEPDLLVIVTTGNRPIEAIPCPIPANARVARFLPFASLMPKIDVLVTNGGFGTTTFALSHGVPVVAAGLTEDKAEVSARVAWSGCGVNLATNTPTAGELRRAIRMVLDSLRYRENAGKLKAEFSKHDTHAELLQLIYECAAS